VFLETLKYSTNKFNHDNYHLQRKKKHLIYNGKLIDAIKEPLTVSNNLNNYFSTTGKNLANSIKQTFDQDSGEGPSLINFNKYLSFKIKTKQKSWI
jgi:hypothetical protein